jgi:hypothetical protein
MATPIPADAAILGVATCILWTAFALLGRAYERVAVLKPVHPVIR